MNMQTPQQAITEALFADPDLHAHAVLDGASIESLLPALHEHEPQHVCLYRGEIEPDVAMCAPYLVRLEADTPFTTWMIESCWAKHWGIFALAPRETTFRDLRKHFRTFLMIKNTVGKSVYFRYYDPRVLRAFLPSCNEDELEMLFGPLAAYLVEDARHGTLVSLSMTEGRLNEQILHQVKLAMQEEVA